jgi:hypothetical protein
MKSRFITPKYETLSAVVLSANDVVATVLVLDVDEDGYSPGFIADVELPFEARNYRKQNPKGTSMLQRGDLITIKCNVTKEKLPKLPDRLIQEILSSLFDVGDENADLFYQINERARKFTVEWAEICKKDMKRR